MRGSAWIYVVMMTQFVLKIEKLSHITGARGSQYLRSPSPIMAPGFENDATVGFLNYFKVYPMVINNPGASCGYTECV